MWIRVWKDENKIKNNFREEQFSFKTKSFLKLAVYYILILHLLLPFYLIFQWVDPQSSWKRIRSKTLAWSQALWLGAGAAWSRGIFFGLEATLWPGSGSNLNICLIIHANYMKLKATIAREFFLNWDWGCRLGPTQCCEAGAGTFWSEPESV